MTILFAWQIATVFAVVAFVITFLFCQRFVTEKKVLRKDCDQRIHELGEANVACQKLIDNLQGDLLTMDDVFANAVGDIRAEQQRRKRQPST